MTTAQQTADSANPRELTDAAAPRDKAAAFIREYMRANEGALPSGEMVGDHCGMTGRWGQKQLGPFRGSDGEAASGTPARRRGGTVGDLVSERAGSSPAAAVIGSTGPERPLARSGARPAERLSPPAPTAPERSGAMGGAASGTRTPPPSGTSTWWGKVGEFVSLSPLLAIAAGAFVSIWGGWVGLGKLTGFGDIELLPGIVPGWTINTAITLPLGMEAYAAYALRVWLAPPPRLTEFARTFARRSAIGALFLGALGQIAYHLMTAAGVTQAPWFITVFVACLPVGVLGCGAALAHLVRHPEGRS